MVLIGSMGNWI